MKYVYPAIFTPLEEGGFDVRVPDLPGCGTCGDDLADAISMAEDAVSMWLWDAENKREPIPAATPLAPVEAPQFVSYVLADTDKYRRRHPCGGRGLKCNHSEMKPDDVATPDDLVAIQTAREEYARGETISNGDIDWN